MIYKMKNFEGILVALSLETLPQMLVYVYVCFKGIHLKHVHLGKELFSGRETARSL